MATRLYDLDGNEQSWEQLHARREAYYARQRAGDTEYARWLQWKLSEPSRPPFAWKRVQL